MKATGIVRKIDELGRIVIPREIRKTLHIKDGSALEIFTSGNGDIIFRKYSPVGEAMQLAEDLCSTISETTGLNVIITDTESVVATSTEGLETLKEVPLSPEMLTIIEKGEQYGNNHSDKIALSRWSNEWHVEVLCPVTAKNEIVGSVAIISNEPVKIDVRERVLVKIAADILGKQMD